MSPPQDPQPSTPHSALPPLATSLTRGGSGSSGASDAGEGREASGYPPAHTYASSDQKPPFKHFPPPSRFSMPALVDGDWSYRVNDHRRDGASLVPVCGSSGGGRSRGVGGRGPVSIAAGWRHSVAVTAEGATFVWGYGSQGRLGLGSHADVETPRQVGH